MKKITHEMACLYVLLRQHLRDKDEYISPSAVDIGDLHIEELGEYVFTTWKTPTRLTDIFQNNPGLLERTQVLSKSGTKYYKYRLSQYFTMSVVRENHLREFLEAVSKNKTFTPREKPSSETCEHGIPHYVKCPYNCTRV